MSGGGWLTTKKAGRDDKEIEAAKKQAVERQRARKGLKPLKPKAKKAPAKKKAPRRKAWEESESEESFLEEDDELSEEEEEEDVVLTEEESSDDDNEGSFLPKSKRKNVKIKPMLETKARDIAKAKKKNGYDARRKVTSSSEEEDDGSSFSSDDDGPFSKFKFKRAAKPTAAARKKQDESSDDDWASKRLKVTRPTAAARKNKVTADFASSDSKIEEVSPPPPRANKDNTKTFSKYFSSDANKKSTTPWDDTPPKSRVAANKNKRRSISADEDEEDEHQKTPRRSMGDSSWVPEAEDYEDEDGGFMHSDDEAMAVAMAESRKTAKKEDKKRGKLKKLGGNKKKNPSNNHNNKGKRKKVHRNDSPSADLDDTEDEEAHNFKNVDIGKMLEDSEEEEEEKAIDIMSSSEDDGADDDDEADEYMDEEEREASQVLNAANELSGSVLRIMTSWASDMNSEEGKQPAVPQGMIVDGAIAMTSMRRNPRKNNSQHAWISNEVMQEVLPNVTLAEYQLLGVNWLAMLHSMTCKVTHRKDAKATNVNGILADEMGLGKTCQTIAFLAWLKHSRSKGGIKEIGEGVAKKGDDISDDDVSDNEGDNEDDVEVIDADAKPAPTPKTNKHAEVSMRSSAEEKSQDSLPHLIIVPASVVSNWEREFQNFAPHMTVVKYHGTQDERVEMKRKLRDFMPKTRRKDVPMIDVILCPITYFQKESSEDRDFLRKFNFDYLVCDEGHLLKNAKGLRYRNIDRFRTRHRLLLTGTPIQNSPQELMALLCFLMPLFKKRNTGFDEDNDDGGESMLQHFVNLEGTTSNQETSHEAAYRKLKQLFAPFVLRRKKAQVLSQVIPPKSYEVEFVQLEQVARETYNSIINAHLKAKRNKTKSVTDHLFTSLRKAAHHPHLLRTRHTSSAEKAHLAKWFLRYGAFRGEAATEEKVSKELEGYSDFDLHLTALELLDEYPLRSEQLNRYLLTPEDLFASAKLMRLQELLPKLIDEGHRILIFSVWTMCLDLLGCLLEHMGIQYMRMDGQTAVSDRQEKIDKFNADQNISVFLLSTNACGMGINLTSADTCIMHDISVNPFVDLQAEDRCHRIGQKKPVKIIKLVAKDTVDSDIYDMQERKVKMNAAIMESPSGFQEKKEKTQIMKNIVERHSESSGKAAAAASVAGKENLVNGSKSDVAETKV